MSLKATKIRLKSYTGNDILVKWQMLIQLGDCQMELPLIILDGNSPTVLGWNWLKQLNLPWQNIFRVHFVQETETTDFEQLLSKYQIVFDKRLGQALGTPARLYVNPEAKPMY